MTNEQIIKEIGETIKYNKAAREAGLIELYKDAFRKSNDVLARARHCVESNDDYERGLDDAWLLASRILSATDDAPLVCKEIREIFACDWSEVFRKYTVHDAMKRYNDWLKKKEEEAAKPVMGDVIDVYIPDIDQKFRLIYVCGGPAVFYGFDEFKTLVNIDLSKYFDHTITKIGAHVDILGEMDKFWKG